MLTKEKVELFKNLFKGRTDAYGLEVEGSVFTDRTPLTEKTYLAHINGHRRIGVFPLTEDNKVFWSAVDVDNDSVEDVKRISASCVKFGINYYIEKSKSKGFHVWSFYNQPVDASIVRQAVKTILADAGISEKTHEIFPKQDLITSEDGVGNFIFLPLHKGSMGEDRTVFLNFDLEPVKDQWAFLKGISPTKAEIVQKIALQSPQKPVKPPEPAPDMGIEGDGILGGGDDGVLDVGRYLEDYGVAYTLKEEGNRRIYKLAECRFADLHTTPSGHGHSAIIQGADGKLTYYCFHKHCEGKTWSDARLTISDRNSLKKYINKALIIDHSLYIGDETLKKENKFLKTDNILKGKDKISLVSEVEGFISVSNGAFSVSDAYQSVSDSLNASQCVSRVRRDSIRNILHRLWKVGKIKRVGNKDGVYERVDTELERIDFQSAEAKSIELKFPLGEQELIKIYPKQIIAVAGVPDTGKTAYCLNFILLNMGRYPNIRYFSSEFIDVTLRLRLEKFEEMNLCQLTGWNFQPYNRSSNFSDVLDKDGINVIDFLEIHDEYWKVGGLLQDIYSSLNKGVVLVALQKDPQKIYGRGGAMGLEKPILYLTLDRVEGGNKASIQKAKSWATDRNPLGLECIFKIVGGSKIIKTRDWERGL